MVWRDYGDRSLGQTLTRSFMERKAGILCGPQNDYITRAVAVRSCLLRVFLSYPLCDRRVSLELGNIHLEATFISSHHHVSP